MQSAAETTSVTMNEELAAALNRWRMSQSPVPTPNEAIFQLLTLALDKEGVSLPESLGSRVQKDDPVSRLIAAMKAAQ